MGKRIFHIFLVLTVLTIFPSYLDFPNLAAAQQSPNPSTRIIQLKGFKRIYQIYIPPSYDPTRPLPLVFVLHGGGGSGKNAQQVTSGSFNKLADKEKFIVVYPDAYGGYWNDGRGIPTFRSHKENIDDVGFISDLIDQLSKKYKIDRKRVYVTGISNGGLMAYRLACKLSAKIAAIAPVAGAMPEKIVPQCLPSRPVSLLTIHGTEDPMVPFDGGEVVVKGEKRGKTLSVSACIQFWVTHNQCRSKPVMHSELDQVPDDGTKVYQQEYSGGKEGSEVVLYTIKGGGHTWPGGLQYLPEKEIGKTSREINATEVIWEFFKRHPQK